MRKSLSLFVAIFLLATMGTTAQNKWAGQNKASSAKQQTAKLRSQDLLGAGVSYTTLDYSTTVATNGTPTTGSLTTANNTITDPYGSAATGKGYSFQAQAGKAYKITCTYTTTQFFNDYIGVCVLTSDPLGGSSDIKKDIYDELSAATQTTVTGNYTSDISGLVRILLYDNSAVNSSYSIKVEEIMPAVSYTTINYNSIATNGTLVSGTLTEAKNQVNTWTETIKGYGYSFQTQIGKTYKVTCSYFAPQAVSFNTGFYLLNGGTLQGSYDDIINYNGSYQSYSNQMTTSLEYTATANGSVRILLENCISSDLQYSVKVEEVVQTTAMTITQLLNATTKTITYSSNLSYKDNGTTTSLVAGNSAIYFKTVGKNYYAVSYKITLSANNTIQIHSSKESDSHLFIYKANGTGGYDYVNDMDQGNGSGDDSRFSFTPTTSGDYYLVVTDYFPNTSGRYYINVWNTTTEPTGNAYPTQSTIISSITSSSNNITVATNATDEAIRAELIKLVITGNCTGSSTSILNNPYTWVISADKKTATYMPTTAPDGYTLNSSIQPVSVTIKYGTSGINDANENPVKVHAANGNIIISSVEVGARILVADVSGKIVTNIIAKNSEVIIPVTNSGLYIVRVNNQSVKVLCK